jgi:hypothetical protein
MSTPRTEERQERRAEARRACHRPCLVRFDRRRLDGRAGTVGAEGAMIDLSPCGVALLLRSAVPPGTMFALDPLDSGAPPLPPACVIHCVPAGGRWRLGCGLGRRLEEQEWCAWLT